MKKFKWPKFLNLKRTILLTILVLVVGYLLIYFLGGYKEASRDANMKDFVHEGFESYEQTINNIVNTQVKTENDAFEAKCKVLTKDNYSTEVPNLINELVTKTNGDYLRHLELGPRKGEVDLGTTEQQIWEITLKEHQG